MVDRLRRDGAGGCEGAGGRSPCFDGPEPWLALSPGRWIERRAERGVRRFAVEPGRKQLVAPRCRFIYLVDVLLGRSSLGPGTGLSGSMLLVPGKLRVQRIWPPPTLPSMA